MGIFDDALASVRTAELDTAQSAALDQIGAALGTIDSLTTERDNALRERNELLGKYTSLLETNMKLALAQTPTAPAQPAAGSQSTAPAAPAVPADPYANVPKWEVTDLYGQNKKKEG